MHKHMQMLTECKGKGGGRGGEIFSQLKTYLIFDTDVS